MSADKVQALQKIRQKRRDVALAAYKRYERAIDEAKVVWIGEDQYFITRIELIDGWNEGTEWDIHVGVEHTRPIVWATAGSPDHHVQAYRRAG